METKQQEVVCRRCGDTQAQGWAGSADFLPGQTEPHPGGLGLCGDLHMWQTSYPGNISTPAFVDQEEFFSLIHKVIKERDVEINLQEVRKLGKELWHRVMFLGRTGRPVSTPPPTPEQLEARLSCERAKAESDRNQDISTGPDWGHWDWVDKIRCTCGLCDR